MEEFKKVVDELQRSVKSLQDQITSLKSGEVPSGTKTPGERSSPVQQVGDEVPTWAERMELETEAGDEIRRVKVCEETELVLQKAFVPLKNQDHRALRRQYLVPDMPLTMAPKLDKVMAAECVPAVRSSDQTLARLQALVLDAVGPLTDLLERINRSVPSEGQEDEEEQGVDLQSIGGDSVQSALAFLGNAATQFSAYRRTKILEEYNKDLVSFSEEVEPALQAAAPLLFGQSFTKQAADHLGQVEALRKVKGKGKKVFFKAPPAKADPVAGGKQALPSKLWSERDFRPEHTQKAAGMAINFSRAEGSDCRRAKGSYICNAVNTKCVNCQSYNAKTTCFGFHSGTKTCEQSTGGGKNVSLCHQLESNNPGPVGPSYGAGLPHSFQGGASSSARTSPMSVFRGTNEAFARGGNLLAGEGGSGDSGACCLGRRVLLDPLPGAQDGRSDEAGHKSKSTELLGSSPALQDGRYPYVAGYSSARRMACQTGSEGRLLHSTNPSGSLEVPSLRGGPGSLPIHMSTIRSILCSLGFYQSA